MCAFSLPRSKTASRASSRICTPFPFLCVTFCLWGMKAMIHLNCLGDAVQQILHCSQHARSAIKKRGWQISCVETPATTSGIDSLGTRKTAAIHHAENSELPLQAGPGTRCVRPKTGTPQKVSEPPYGRCTFRGGLRFRTPLRGDGFSRLGVRPAPRGGPRGAAPAVAAPAKTLQQPLQCRTRRHSLWLCLQRLYDPLEHSV